MDQIRRNRLRLDLLVNRSRLILFLGSRTILSRGESLRPCQTLWHVRLPANLHARVTHRFRLWIGLRLPGRLRGRVVGLQLRLLILDRSLYLIKDGLSRYLRLNRCAGCSFGCSDSSPRLRGLKFAITRRFRITRGNACCRSGCTAICRNVLFRKFVIIEDRNTLASLMLRKATIDLLLPRWQRCGRARQCAQNSKFPSIFRNRAAPLRTRS